MLNTLLLSLVLLSWSHFPQKQPGPNADKKQATSDQRGTDARPLSVKLMNTGETREQADRETNRIEQERKNAERAFGLSVVAAIIGLLTFAFLVAQSWYLRRTVVIGEEQAWMGSRSAAAAERATSLTRRALEEGRESSALAVAQSKRFARAMEDSASAMERAANAAAASADVSMASERAYMFLSTSDTRNENAKIVLVFGSARPLYFVNLGKTPARIESVIASCRYWEKEAVEQLTDQPDAIGQKIETFAVWLAGGREPLGVKYVQCTAAANEIQKAAKGDGMIALIGHIAYRDIFDDAHDFGFAFEMSGNPPVIVEIPNPHLNYSR